MVGSEGPLLPLLGFPGLEPQLIQADPGCFIDVTVAE